MHSVRPADFAWLLFIHHDKASAHDADAATGML
jgi:hypothetical protein